MMIQGILLAAGAAKRFGSHKLLYPLADGTPIAAAAARHIKKSMQNVLAIVKPNDIKLAKLLSAEGLDIAIATNSELGISASLIAGIQATQHAAGWVVALADMPFIQPTTISHTARLLAEGATMVAPFYLGQRGHPVGLSKTLLPDLLKLSGDTGAGMFLKQNSHLLTQFNCDDIGVLRDIDTKFDLLVTPDNICLYSNSSTSVRRTLWKSLEKQP